jgi:26S proteasome regulatory subunit N8
MLRRLLTKLVQDGTTTSKTFVHTPTIIEAEEAEEIGVEHLLRDIRDVAVGTLSTRVTNQLQSLQGLHLRLRDIQAYLQKVLDGQLPVNHAILGNLQDVFNLLPNLSTPKPGAAASGAKGGDTELNYAMSVKSNDQLMAIYLSSLIRAITAFHDLIENKIQNRQQQEEKEAAKKEGENSGKDGEKKEGSPVNGDSKEAGGDKEKEGSKDKKK